MEVEGKGLVCGAARMTQHVPVSVNGTAMESVHVEEQEEVE